MSLMVHTAGLSGTQLQLLKRIAALFAVHGARLYDNARREPVTALAHALQCAQLAEWADAELLLRRWDDAAKEPGRRTPPLMYYLDLLADVMRTPHSDVLPL